jgi:hypothetical protein
MVVRLSAEQPVGEVLWSRRGYMVRATIKVVRKRDLLTRELQGVLKTGFP